jgi:hypothetical protein
MVSDAGLEAGEAAVVIESDSSRWSDSVRPELIVIESDVASVSDSCNRGIVDSMTLSVTLTASVRPAANDRVPPAESDVLTESSNVSVIVRAGDRLSVAPNLSDSSTVAV